MPGYKNLYFAFTLCCLAHTHTHTHTHTHHKIFMSSKKTQVIKDYWQQVGFAEGIFLLSINAI